MFINSFLFFIGSEIPKSDIINSFCYDLVIQLITFLSTVGASLIIFYITERKKREREKERIERENAIYYLDQYLTFTEKIKEAINNFNWHYSLTGRKPKFNVESFDPIFHVNEANKYLFQAKQHLERFEFLFVQFPEEYELLDLSIYIYQTYEKQLDSCTEIKEELFEGSGKWEVKEIDYSLITNNDILTKYHIDIINFFYQVIQKNNI